MRTVQGSLAIEGSTLTQQQITAILDGKRIIAPPKEVQEAHNAISTYDALAKWQPANSKHLLAALIKSDAFIAEMKRFLPTDVFDRTLAWEKFQVYLTSTLIKLFKTVQDELSGKVSTVEFKM